MRIYPAVVNRWKDGDTLEVLIDLGFYVHKVETIRLLRINAPEKKDTIAQVSIQKVNELAPVNSKVSLHVKGKDKYGRWLAEVYPFGKDQNIMQSLSSILLEAKVVYPYTN